MTKAEGEEFAAALTALGQVHGRNLSASAIAIYFRILDGYSWDQIKFAMSKHERDPHEGRFFPTPAHLLAYLKPKTERLGADEMWALMPLSEAQSVVWTKEAKEAFFQAAIPLIEENDLIAARMAFRAAYERLCEDADANNESIAWEFSEGTDKNSKERVLANAVRLGRIRCDVAVKRLTHLAPDELKTLFPAEELLMLEDFS